MRIYFLGTSAGIPTKDRNVSCVAVRRGGELLLFDVGEGTQRQLIKAGLGLKTRTKILITHMHGDHLVGLPALLQSFTLARREDPLIVFGPEKIHEFINGNLKTMGVGPTFPIQIHTLTDGFVHRNEEYIIRALRTRHSVETYALSLEEKRRPGKFDPKRAESLKIPVILWRNLQRGERVTVGKREIDPRLVVSEPRKGRKIVISSDTYPFDAMGRFAKGADVLIHESTYGEDHLDKTEKHLHSSAAQAARIASRAPVSLLVLTHFSTRYNDVSGLVEEARRVFPRVVAARDFMVVTVAYP
ncbi:MAG: ribonuclease Z [Candidatus Geothermarchaeales archaeon]